jgi:hypothetical protein
VNDELVPASQTTYTAVVTEATIATTVTAATTATVVKKKATIATTTTVTSSTMTVTVKAAEFKMEANLKWTKILK